MGADGGKRVELPGSAVTSQPLAQLSPDVRPCSRPRLRWSSKDPPALRAQGTERLGRERRERAGGPAAMRQDVPKPSPAARHCSGLVRRVLTIAFALLILGLMTWAYAAGVPLASDRYGLLALGLAGAFLSADLVAQSLFAYLQHRRGAGAEDPWRLVVEALVRPRRCVCGSALGLQAPGRVRRLQGAGRRLWREKNSQAFGNQSTEVFRVLCVL
ncbi:uncharacterized protein LOC124250314 [Equus quagga]|uniref:uncharacterized protein LOC124250314 n=1 Tax=Equus quagga TaxID=89248 RepID=UPI001EE257E1|nr:uncharacterized protein LOC124250314 [Equus quagga]